MAPSVVALAIVMLMIGSLAGRNTSSRLVDRSSLFAGNDERSVHKPANTYASTANMSNSYARQSNSERDSDWPCPAANSILPCTCTFSNDLIDISCRDVADIQAVAKVFMTPFPMTKLNKVTIELTQPSNGAHLVDIPTDFLFDKEPMMISFKGDNIKSFAPDAIRSSRLEILSIEGIDYFHRQPLNYFPMKMLNSMPNLRILRITNSQLESYSVDELETMELPNLEELYLYANKLTSLNQLGAAPKLTQLDLALNPLESITEQAFINLPSLEVINLHSIKLKHLRTNTLQVSSSRLERVELHNSDLAIFSTNFVSNVNPDTVFNFDGNEIRTIRESVFRALLETLLTGSGYIDFSDNPLLCDCSIRWLVLARELVGVLQRADMWPTCESGTLLSKLNPSLFDKC